LIPPFPFPPGANRGGDGSPTPPTAGGSPHKRGIQSAPLNPPLCIPPVAFRGYSCSLDAGKLVRQKEPMSDLVSSWKSYQDLLATPKSQIRTAKVRVAVAVNRSSFCSMGRFEKRF